MSKIYADMHQLVQLFVKWHNKKYSGNPSVKQHRYQLDTDVHLAFRAHRGCLTLLITAPLVATNISDIISFCSLSDDELDYDEHHLQPISEYLKYVNKEIYTTSIPLPYTVYKPNTLPLIIFNPDLLPNMNEPMDGEMMVKTPYFEGYDEYPIIAKNRRRILVNTHIYAFDYRNPFNDVYILNKVHSEDMYSMFRCMNEKDKNHRKQTKRMLECARICIRD
jgi:hypothetical protein